MKKDVGREGKPSFFIYWGIIMLSIGDYKFNVLGKEVEVKILKSEPIDKRLSDICIDVDDSIELSYIDLIEIDRIIHSTDQTKIIQ